MNANVTTYGKQIYITARFAELKSTHFRLVQRSLWTLERAYRLSQKARMNTVDIQMNTVFFNADKQKILSLISF